MKCAKAFTLVEILIVVVLLGILAAVVIPTIASSATSARETALASDVQLLRRFILVYKAQHQETSPGYLNGTLSYDNFVEQATEATDDLGRTSDNGGADCNRGPYMSKIPKNPINGLNTVEMISDSGDLPTIGNNSHGWVYKASTGEIYADSPGQDDNGRNYFDY